MTLFASALLTTFVFALGAQSTAGPQRLTAQELKRMKDSGQKLLFLDVREPAELEELGTIEGYKNIPLGQVERRAAELPKDVLIVAACNRARRAATAAEVLNRKGYSRVKTFAMQDWTGAGYPVIHPKADPKRESKKD